LKYNKRKNTQANPYYIPNNVAKYPQTSSITGKIQPNFYQHELTSMLIDGELENFEGQIWRGKACAKKFDEI